MFAQMRLKEKSISGLMSQIHRPITTRLVARSSRPRVPGLLKVRSSLPGRQIEALSSGCTAFVSSFTRPSCHSTTRALILAGSGLWEDYSMVSELNLAVYSTLTLMYP
jgi:hypothetical protein